MKRKTMTSQKMVPNESVHPYSSLPYIARNATEVDESCKVGCYPLSVLSRLSETKDARHKGGRNITLIGPILLAETILQFRLFLPNHRPGYQQRQNREPVQHNFT